MKILRFKKICLSLQNLQFSINFELIFSFQNRRRLLRRPYVRQAVTMLRRRFQYCKVIVATSLVWFLLDVLLLMYYTDCASDNPCPGKSGQHVKKQASLLERLLPKGNPKGGTRSLHGW